MRMEDEEEKVEVAAGRRLDAEDFERAIARYLEETSPRPDPPARRQIQSLVLSWEEEEDVFEEREPGGGGDKIPSGESDHRYENEKESCERRSSAEDDADRSRRRRRIRGTLTMGGEYASVKLNSDCSWTRWGSSFSAGGKGSSNAADDDRIVAEEVKGGGGRRGDAEFPRLRVGLPPIDRTGGSKNRKTAIAARGGGRRGEEAGGGGISGGGRGSTKEG